MPKLVYLHFAPVEVGLLWIWSLFVFFLLPCSPQFVTSFTRLVLPVGQAQPGGAAAACAVIVFELRVRALTLRRLIGAVAGSILGIFGAALFCLVLRSAPLNSSTSAVLQIFVLLLMTYVGLLVGRARATC